MGTSTATLKARLDSLCVRYDTAGALAKDPLSVPLAYESPLDREVAAFVAAHLAYGRVDPMIRAVRGALTPLGAGPSAWLRESSEAAIRRDLARALADWAWRFHTADDLAAWLLAWKRLDGESGAGLEAHLLPAPRRGSRRRALPAGPAPAGGAPGPYGSRFSLPDPLEGAACKRWRMFLRWMARPGWPDLGLWTRYPVDQLIIPLDTHVARVSRFIGLSRRATPDGKMAREITEALRRLDPADPLRYDFALSHLGILGDCPGVRKRSTCAECPGTPCAGPARNPLRGFRDRKRTLGTHWERRPVPTRERKPQAPCERMASPALFCQRRKRAGLATALGGTT